MNRANPVLVELTHLSEDTYFSSAQEPLFNLQMKVNQALAALPTPETERLVISKISSLDIDRHQDFPVLLLRYSSGLRNWKISTALNYYLLAQDLDSGLLKIHSLAEKGEERAAAPLPSASGKQPDSNTAEATGTSLRRYYLRQRLKLDWQPSRLAFTVINYDASSNTLPVTLTKTNLVQPKSALPIVRTSEFLKSLPSAVPTNPSSEDIGLSISSSISHQITIQNGINGVTH